ncbi:MAG TPA: EAL domain-containing protein [Steroidobacteraceae bacterium]|nr:EAL domain-containing protein [Steroidobacteraceae bacterium]
MQTKAPDATEVPLHELLAEVLAGDPAAGGFEVHYQPIVRIASRATVAVEALACWRHPDVGIVEPPQFMAAAERTGLTGVLDDFVLNQACAAADALAAAHGFDVPVHVNVAARRLTRPDLYAVIDWALGRYRLAAGRLVIEVAQTDHIEDIGAAARAIKRIRDRGVRVCIDDFGAGYDIMTRLQGLPIDLIKLDARVTGAGVDTGRTEAMCQAVLEVCERIGLSVIAQGITTAGQALALHEMGCQLGQGPLYGPPLRLEQERKIGSRALKNG